MADVLVDTDAWGARRSPRGPATRGLTARRSSPGLQLAFSVAAVVAATGCVWALITLPAGAWRHGFDTRAG